jgi:hypothetical protein
MAPVDGGAQRLMPEWRETITPCQELEALVQATTDL